jgi:D-alanyl-D-alanine carboxypeptidase (penicillin-binding protein 5/6)
MRRVWIGWRLLALIPLLFAIVHPVQSSFAQESPATPAISAQASYVYDATLDVELSSDNSDEQRAPASTVKIVTAMVVMDHADLSTELTVLEDDVATDDESRMGLVAGDTVTVDQLMYGLMLPSGNDAARTLARHVGGMLLNGEEGDPVERFVQAMNDKVAEAGLSNSQFTSPDGLSDDPEQYSTAFDLAHLGAMAMGYNKIEEVVALSSIEITSVGPEARVYGLSNTNQFLPGSGTDFATDNVIGLKSGSTSAAGACLVLARRERGGNLVIAVVLGSDLSYDDAGLIEVDARWQDMSALLDDVDSEWAWVNPESDRDVPGLAQEMAAWEVALKDDSGLLVTQSQRTDLAYRIELLPDGPSEADAGRVLFFAGTEQVGERPLMFR